MIMLCKHCFDILGYDNKYTNRIINQECDHCKKGLRTSDVVYAEDIMVPLIFKLNKELNIKTYYSCVGRLDNNKIIQTYIVVEDTEKARYIFNEIISIEHSYGSIRRDGKDKIRIEFKDQTIYNSIYEHTLKKVELINFIDMTINRLTNSKEYPFK